ncbi:MAG: SAM-dependent methyltransferase [Bacteroidetes bacterium 4572_77]|nr:MAG: SAM-dependent methyltransferase [Bacteroidetes bacterium 4572_77]
MKKDVMGWALMDHYKGQENVTLKVSIDVAGEENYAASYFFRDYSEMPDLEKKALDLSSGKILDVGAGTGIHALELQKRGQEVCALEISDINVQIMQERGVTHVIHADFFKLQDQKYDTLLFLMNGIGLVKNMQGFEEFFQQCQALLNPGGQILFDSSDLLYLYEEEDGSYLINLNEKYYGEVIFQTEYKGEKGEAFPWLFVDFDNLNHQADKYGFQAELIQSGMHFDYLARITRKI